MNVTVTIPDQVAGPFQSSHGDLGRALIESLALEGYKSGKLSQYQVQLLLGFDNRWDTENWLGDHGAERNYSQADFEEDGRYIQKHFGAQR